MRREPHPLTGILYEEQPGGTVRVVHPDSGKYGIFKPDGTWLEGEVTHADPHFLLYVGGPNLPEGKDIYWGFMQPLEEDNQDSKVGGGASIAMLMEGAPRIVAKYQADPGQMTEAGMRSTGHYDLKFILDHDRRPELIPEVYHLENPFPGGPVRVPVERYHQQRYHDREVERIWKKTWQYACREDDIPEIGDYHVYDIANLSYLIVRTGPHEFKAHQNVCLHRGRALRDRDGKRATEFRCAYHGWSWKLDGSIKEIPCEWDFPGVRADVEQLPGAQVGTWAGSIFINPDPAAESLESYLGPVMMAHYEKFELQNRYKSAHARRIMHANWKLVKEAFMEAYHVIATHPQMMFGATDGANGRYDAWGHWHRAGHLSGGSASPQRGLIPTPEQTIAEFRGMADFNRAFLRGIIGDEVEKFSDAEMNDGSFNSLFPNLHPWGGWARIHFVFRPNGSNPNQCIMDVVLLAPWPKGKPKPPAAKVHTLGPDESWTNVPMLGSLARIIDQDCNNLARVQAMLPGKTPDHVWYSAYQESQIRHFHSLYDRYMGLDATGRIPA